MIRYNEEDEDGYTDICLFTDKLRMILLRENIWNSVDCWPKSLPASQEAFITSSWTRRDARMDRAGTPRDSKRVKWRRWIIEREI